MAVRFIARVPDEILREDARRSALAHLCGELVTGASWLEADLLVSLVDTDLAVVAGLLPDEGALTPALDLLRAGLGPEPHGTGFELYPQTRFTHADGVWQPDPAHHVPSVVGGPHGGRGVRILIQRAFEGTEEVHERWSPTPYAHEPSTAAWSTPGPRATFTRSTTRSSSCGRALSTTTRTGRCGSPQASPANATRVGGPGERQ